MFTIRLSDIATALEDYHKTTTWFRKLTQSNEAIVHLKKLYKNFTQTPIESKCLLIGTNVLPYEVNHSNLSRRFSWLEKENTFNFAYVRISEKSIRGLVTRNKLYFWNKLTGECTEINLSKTNLVDFDSDLRINPDFSRDSTKTLSPTVLDAVGRLTEISFDIHDRHLTNEEIFQVLQLLITVSTEKGSEDAVLNNFRTKFSGLIESAKILNNAEIFNQEIFAEIYEIYKERALYSNISLTTIAKCYIQLKEANLFDDLTIRRQIAFSKAPTAAIGSLILMKQANLLTKENASWTIRREFDYREGLRALQAEEMLNQENFDSMLGAGEKKGYSYHMSVVDGLIKLHRATILTKENREAILKHDNSYTVASVYVELSRANILNDITRASVLKFRAHYEVSCVLSGVQLLSSSNLLNDENYSRFIQNRGCFTYFLLTRLPSHLFNQIVFDQIITLGDENTIDEYVHTLLAQQEREQHAHNVHPQETINEGQSTHTASVHKSVTESLIRLKARYGSSKRINQLACEGALQFAYAINEKNFPEIEALKRNAAKDFLCKVSKIWDEEEAGSKVSIQAMLGYIWQAMHDTNLLKCDSRTAEILFIEHLYEITRGYNIDDVGKDNGQDQDLAICISGTINKLVDTLNGGLHPDIDIIFVTKKTAAVKLTIIVRECVIDYVKQSNDKALLLKAISKMEQRNFDKELEKVVISWEIPQEILDQIKEKVLHQFNDEFATFLEIGELSELTDTMEYVLVDEASFKKIEAICKDSPISSSEKIMPPLVPDLESIPGIVSEKGKEKELFPPQEDGTEAAPTELASHIEISSRPTFTTIDTRSSELDSEPVQETHSLQQTSTFFDAEGKPVNYDPDFNPQNSNFTLAHIEEIENLIERLKREINSRWPYPNKDRKEQKMLGLKELLLTLSQGMDAKEAVEAIERKYSEIRKGEISTRTADLLDTLRNDGLSRVSGSNWQ